MLRVDHQQGPENRNVLRVMPTIDHSGMLLPQMLRDVIQGIAGGMDLADVERPW